MRKILTIIGLFVCFFASAQLDTTKLTPNNNASIQYGTLRAIKGFAVPVYNKYSSDTSSRVAGQIKILDTTLIFSGTDGHWRTPKTDLTNYIRFTDPSYTNTILSPQNTTIKVKSSGVFLTPSSAADIFASKQTTYSKTEVDQRVTTTFSGVATTSTNPGTPVTNVFYRANGTGSYTNFLQSAGTPITLSLSDGIVDLIYSTSTGFWTKVAVGLDYRVDTAYDLSKNGLYRDIQTLVSQAVPFASSTFRDTTSTFSGWETNVGALQNADVIVMRIGARATPITSIRYALFVNSDAGTKLTDKTITVSIPAYTYKDVYFYLDSTITNVAGNNLAFVYLCNQVCNRFGVLSQTYFPQPTYPLAKYQTTGSLNFTGMNSVVSATQYSNWFKAGLSGVKVIKTVADNIVSSADSLVKHNFNYALDTAFRNSYVQDNYSTDATGIFSSPSFLPVATDISGWGAPIGTPTGLFNGIKFKVKARAGGSQITSVYVRLERGGSSTGTLVEEKTFTVNIPAGSSQTISWVLNNTIDNTIAGDKFFFSYSTNAITDLYGANGQTPFPESAGYGQTVYYTLANQTGSGSLSSGRYRVYVETGNFTPVIGVTDAYTQYLTSKIGLAINTPQVPTVTVNLNSQLYAVEGKELNVYFDNFISSDYGKADLTYDVTCSKGKQLEKRWTYTPVSSDAGTTTFQVTVNYKGAELLTKSATLITKAASAGTGSSIKINGWGDSHLSGGQYQQAIVNESMTNPAITFIGTQGTGSNKHEGRGGYTYNDYSTAGRTLYKVPMSGIVSTPSIGSTYSNNSSTFQDVENNITSGSGYVSFLKISGTNTPLSSGTLTKVSGSGDATITYASYTVISGNPLWNGTYVDPTTYYAGIGVTMTSSDLVFFNLGINDIFSSAAGLSAIKTQIDTLVNAFHTAIPNIKIGIGVIVPATSNQDGFGENYGNGQTWAAYMDNRRLLNSMILANYDNALSRTNNVFTIPFNVNLDAVNNVQKSTVAANARNSTDQVVKYTNSVHPAQSGYDQMADTLYAFIKSFF